VKLKILQGNTMLLGCKNYFSFFGILLFSVNMTLLATMTRFESMMKTIIIMIEAFLRKQLLKPLLIQQKIKIFN